MKRNRSGAQGSARSSGRKEKLKRVVQALAVAGAIAGGAHAYAAPVRFENPAHGHHWVTLRLEGVASNRDGMGARVRVTVDMGGEAAEFHKLVDGGGSFGANSLQLEIGLGLAVGIREIAITWPTTGRTDVYTDVDMDRVYRVVEGAAELEPLAVTSFTLGSAR